MNTIEQLQHATMMLTVSDGKESWSGTGFVVQFTINPTKHRMLLVTCRHVLEGANELYIQIRNQDRDGNLLANKTTIRMEVGEGIFYHPEPDVDLAAIVFHHIDQKFADAPPELGIKPFYRAISINDVPKDWRDVNVGDDVFIPGSPLGLIDATTALPFVRKGCISSIPKFVSTPYIFIDAPVLEGQSSSPVYLFSHFSPNLGSFGNQDELRTRSYLIGVVATGLESDDGDKTADAHFGKLVRSDKIIDLYDTVMNWVESEHGQ